MEKKEIINLIHNICFEMMDSINAEEISFHDDLVLQINKKICEEVDKRWGDIVIQSDLEQEPRWIPVSERLPKEDEHIGNVCKYYLIQDEYGDMYVAHLSGVGWIPMESLKAIGNEIMAWQELPQAYAPDIYFGSMAESEDKK